MLLFTTHTTVALAGGSNAKSNVEESLGVSNYKVQSYGHAPTQNNLIRLLKEDDEGDDKEQRQKEDEECDEKKDPCKCDDKSKECKDFLAEEEENKPGAKPNDIVDEPVKDIVETFPPTTAVVSILLYQ